MYKLKHGLAPQIMQDLFPLREMNYNLRTCNIFKSWNINTVYNGKETLSFRGPRTWSIVPKDIQDSLSLQNFKQRIKTWKPRGCSCRICTPFIAGLGFI